jgi:hypothetical protein
MAYVQQGAQADGRAKLRNSTTVFFSSAAGVKISRQLCNQEYGMMEFDVIDMNGHRLVFAQPILAKCADLGRKSFPDVRGTRCK